MYRMLALLMTLALVPGCNVLPDLVAFLTGELPGDVTDGTSSGKAELKAFESKDEFNAYFTGQVSERNSGLAAPGGLRTEDGVAVADSAGGDVAFDFSSGPLAAPSDPSLPTDTGTVGAVGEAVGAGDDGVGFSQTTIQEVGVDEADVVKTDGTYIYIISQNTLRVVLASPANELSLLAEVKLEGYGREIYLRGSSVVALTETYGGFFSSTLVFDPGFVDVAVARDAADGVAADGTLFVPDGDVAPVYERPGTIVTVIDMVVPDAPKTVSSTRFDGTVASSRMIDGMLHLVLANYQRDYFDVLPALGKPELDITGVDAETLLPTYVRTDAEGNDTDGPVLAWNDLYRPSDPDGFGVVTVVSIDVDNDATFRAVGVVAEPGLIYSSIQALYLTNTDWDTFGVARETTDIYKLAYDAGGTVPVAAGRVPGRILNQYSMSEYAGYLRAATTVGRTFGMFGEPAGPFNNVYVLDEADGRLAVVGSVEKIAPGEDIKSARFVGDRGYVVTFEQTDPLHTLDLSDPTDPRVIGELEVPGFSTFIIPMDENHLLTVGQYIPSDSFFLPWGVQLSIFDVSDFANPVLAHQVILGDGTGASSEAIYNPKALTYFAEEGLVALPVSIQDNVRFSDAVFFEDGAAGQDEGGTTETVGGPVEVDPSLDEPGAPPDPVDLPDVVDPIEPELPPEIVDPIEPELPDFFAPQGFDGLVVYRVSAEGGFEELGRISTRFEEAGYYWASFTRGVFIGDDVFAVTDNGVRGAPVSDVASVPYELVTGTPNLVLVDEIE